MMRILVPILALIIMIAVALSFALRHPPAPPTHPEASQTLQAPESPETPESPPQATQLAASPQSPPESPPALSPSSTAAALAPIPGLHVLAPAEGALSQHVSIGSDSADPANPYLLKVDLVRYGAGYQRIILARYTAHADSDDRYVVAPEMRLPGATAPWRYPMAAISVSVNGSDPLLLATVPWTLTEHDEAAAQYEITLADADEQPVLRIVRRFQLKPGRYDLSLDQRVENLTGRPVDVVLRQWLQGDLDLPVGDYLGETQRKHAAGYVNPQYDPNKVFTHSAIRPRMDVIKKDVVWPLPAVADKRLAWLGSENRYFALVAHARLPEGATALNAAPYFDDLFASFGVENAGDAKAPVAVLTATTPTLTLDAGGSKSVDLALFAGPCDRDVFDQPPYQPLQLAELIRYEMSSMCSFCTFQWLAKFLLWFLESIHALVYDWGIAIVILVMVVRLLLHPITKKAQVNMMKMGKQMQLLQPEMDKLKKKYKDDQAKLNQEMMKLYREKGFNPAGFVGGCLPMFLQMPIWIALYAMLYFAIELRQQPAFYGLFQTVSDGAWHFLQDLSEPDHFFRFVDPGQMGVKIPLPFINMHISGINILPILMAVVFYFQQKLTTPPPANEQAAQQQKIMKFMVLLFPVFLYSAPSGLTLYILASTAAGIVDSYLVRKHVREQEEAGTLFDKKPLKPGGFRDRMMKKLEEKQAELARRQQGKK